MFSNIFTKDRMEQLRIDRDLYERNFHFAQDQLQATDEKLLKISNKIPFLVEDIRFSTSGSEGNATKFSRKEIDYIYPELKILPLTEAEQTVKVFVKMVRPNGTLDFNPEISPKGFSYSDELEISGGDTVVGLAGWGSKSGNTYERGTHWVEIWAKGSLLAKGSFFVGP